MLNPGQSLLLLGAWTLLLGGCFETEQSEDPAASTGAGPETGGGPTCDPVSFASECVEGRIVECSDDGFVQTIECGPRSRCEIGSDGPGCVWRLGEACDTEFLDCTDPGGILACQDGFWRFTGCPSDGACSDGQCFGPEDTPCEWPNDEPRCEGDAVVTCFPHGFEVIEACGSSEACQLGLMGGVCVADDATPCDPEGSTSTCSAADEIEHCNQAGWTEQIPCPDGDRCFASAFGASCQPEDTPACEPATAVAACVDGVAISCSSLGFETQQQCDADTECLTDESCVFGCQDAATCVPLDAEPCEEPLDTFCMGDTLAICFAGRVLPGFACGCTENEDGASCTAP